MSEPIVISVTGDVVVNAASKPTMGRCATCAHWRWDDRTGHGSWRTCTELQLGESNRSLVVAIQDWRVFDWRASKTSTLTSAGFGCVLWEALP